MRIRLTSVAICTALSMAGLLAGLELRTPSVAAPAATAAPPPDTAMLRAQYEKWRTDFKTWGKFAPLGQESKGTTSLITPEKVAAAQKLVKTGMVISLAHAEPQVAAADVNAAGLFPPHHEPDHRWRHDGQLFGQLSRPDDRAYR